MCGIIGLINCGNIRKLELATKTLSHRGPNGIGIKWLPGINSGIGHTRLSIIDLNETGNQPMCNDNETLWITFNGEIYNYSEIKKELLGKGFRFNSTSDTEVILKSYEEWGTDCLQKFNGIFAFVIIDIRNNKIFGARDRAGVKPFYYYYSDRKLIFSSEIKAILESGEYAREVDYNAIHTTIHYQTSPWTGFKNIKKLLPGNYFILDNGNFHLNCFWKINAIEDSSVSFGYAVEKLDYLLQDSVRLQMVSDVPVGVLLSGGLDSSIVSALMRQNNSDKINSFTIKFKEDDLKLQGNVNDSYFAKKVADKFGFNHHELVIEPDIVDLLPKMIYHLDEPIADPSAINTYLISKVAYENGIKVLLNGMGGDEIFGGYRAQLACLKADIYQKYVPGLLRDPVKWLIEKLPESSSTRNFKKIRWIKRFISFASLPQFERYIAAFNSSLTKTNFNQYYVDPPLSFNDSYHIKRERELFLDNDLSYLTKMCLNDTRVYLPDHNLTYPDKASMAAGVEGRPPLTDHRIIEFMFTLPPEYRINGNVQKYLLKKVSEKYLTDEIIYRPKAPFSAPMRAWLKGPLVELMNDVLSETSLKSRGIYNYKYVSELIRRNNKGIEDNSQLIWRLITNEIWFRTFFK